MRMLDVDGTPRLPTALTSPRPLGETSMTLRRFAARSLPILGALLLTTGRATAVFAADAHQAAPAAAASPRPHAHTRAVAKESEAARRERERREDLERRVERLEQLYELKEPRMPPPDPPAHHAEP
jgi:hypothetical protein